MNHLLFYRIIFIHEFIFIYEGGKILKKKTLIMLVIVSVFGFIAYVTFMPFSPSSLDYVGESETWGVEDVTIRADERLTFEEGTLYMKEQSEYVADYFMLSVHIELKWVGYDADSRMHAYELDAHNLPMLFEGDVLDIAEMDTDWSAPIVLNWLGRPVTMNHIDEVYLIVQWKGEKEDEVQEEKVILTPSDG